MALELIKEYLPYITSLGFFYNILKFGPGVARSFVDKCKVREFDIGDIFDELTEGTLHANSYITTEGYLLKYGQVFKPYTHLNSGWNVSKEKDIIAQLNKKNPLHKGNKSDLVFERERLLMPTQVIPHLGEIGCAFIYDSRFSGFVSNKDLSKSSNTDLLIENNKYTKPILVLYDLKKHSQYINKKMSLKGKIIEMPQEIFSLLNIENDDDIREICSNFYRPKNENNNVICLSLLEENSKVNFGFNYNLDQNFDELSIPLFVETKLDKFRNLESEEASQLIYEMLPNTVHKLNPSFGEKAWLLHDEGEDASSFPSTNKINVMYKDPGTVGFYTTTSLVDSEKYSKDLDELSTYINNFSIDYKNLSKKHFGEKDKLDITFLFDYNKKELFKSRDSNISFSDDKQWSNQKTEVSDTLKWLGQKSKSPIK